jgi:hypothetical protein
MSRLFAAKKAFTGFFNIQKFGFNYAILTINLANLSSVFVGFALDEDPAQAKNPAASAIAAAAIETDIAKLETRANLFEEIKQTFPNTNPATEKKYWSSAREADETSFRITQNLLMNRDIGEQNAQALIDRFKKAIGENQIPAPIQKLGSSYGHNSSAVFFDECRAQLGNKTSMDSMVSCAAQLNEQEKDKVGFIKYTFQASASLTIIGLGVLGWRMRRRVEEEEKQIKIKETQKSIDDLRDLITPKKPISLKH